MSKVRWHLGTPVVEVMPGQKANLQGLSIALVHTGGTRIPRGRGPSRTALTVFEDLNSLLLRVNQERHLSQGGPPRT